MANDKFTDDDQQYLIDDMSSNKSHLQETRTKQKNTALGVSWASVSTHWPDTKYKKVGQSNEKYAVKVCNISNKLFKNISNYISIANRGIRKHLHVLYIFASLCVYLSFLTWILLYQTKNYISECRIENAKIGSLLFGFLCACSAIFGLIAQRGLPHQVATTVVLNIVTVCMFLFLCLEHNNAKLELSNPGNLTCDYGMLVKKRQVDCAMK